MADLALPLGPAASRIAIPPAAERQAAVVAMASTMMAALEENDLDPAERALECLSEMTGRSLDDAEFLLFRVIIAIQRGQAHAALQHLNGLGEEVCPELRVLCLYSMRDPYWEGLAQELADSSTTPTSARTAMAQMLARKSAIVSGSGR